MKKKCTKCKKKKDISLFCKDKKSEDGHFYRCKSCEKQRKKKYYDEVYCEIAKEQYPKKSKNIKQYNKKYHSKNKYAILLRNKKWRTINKEHIHKKANLRYKNDIQHRLKTVLRSRVYSAIKNQKSIKSKKTMELVGCEISFLKTYLTNLFQKEMSWDNYGDWEIDHIIPCYFFDFNNINHQLVCFNYRNLQPMWGFGKLQ
jgi:hypothetical protein